MARPAIRRPSRALISREAAAEYLSVSCRHIDRLLDAATPRVRLGRAVRIPVAALDAIIGAATQPDGR